jgi:hypothetical protein
MSIIYDALKKVEQKISPANQKGTEPMPKTGKFPIKTLLLVAAVFVLGLFIAKYIFSTFLSTDSIRAALPAAPSVTKAQPAEKKSPASIPPKAELTSKAESTPSAESPLPVSAAKTFFGPVITKMKPKGNSSFVLNGVVSSGEEGYALINNQIVQKGDTIGGAKVVSITIDGVDLESGSEIIRLKEGKGETRLPR